MFNRSKQLRNALDQANVQHGSVRMKKFRECNSHANSHVWDVSDLQKEQLLSILPEAQIIIDPFGDIAEVRLG